MQHDAIFPRHIGPLPVLINEGMHGDDSSADVSCDDAPLRSIKKLVRQLVVVINERQRNVTRSRYEMNLSLSDWSDFKTAITP